MPRDKAQSHARVLEAAKTEFLEKGFEKASIRDIGKRAGMTSAGLYRHCKDKEDLFRQVIEPLLQEMTAMMKEHRNNANKAVESGIGIQDSFYTGEIQIIEDPEGKLIWECPNCGNRDQDKMNVARRTCGYIGTQFWNQGRTQEIKERVLHL